MRSTWLGRKALSWGLIAAFMVTLINVGSPRAEAVSAKINLTADMVKSEMTPVLGEIEKIVDEQTEAGDPKGGTGTRFLTKQWHAGWSTAATGATAYLDLGQDYVLTDIYLNDGTSGGDLVVSAGSPGNWTPLFTDSLPGYQQWIPHAVNVTTRYVQFKRLTTNSNFHEVVLYGYAASTSTDTIPPAASTLIAGTATATTIPISWTAPGDDGNTGTATEYDIRYSTSDITTENWDNASPASGEPTPGSAVTTLENYTLTGLSANTTYYIALRTLDEANNLSALSNVLIVTTPSSSSDTIPPAASSISAVSVLPTTIPIVWTSPGDDGTSGWATEYDIRYSTSNITTANWHLATKAKGEPRPGEGTKVKEVYRLTGLTPNTTYYIALKTLDEAYNESPLSNVLTVTTPALGGTPGQIILTPDMLLDERGIDGGKARLVDDQTVTPRTAEANRWSAGSQAKFHPASFVIDLGADFALTSINILDSNDVGNVSVSAGTPFSWTLQFTDSMNQYNNWSDHTVSTTTRYVRVVIEDQSQRPWIAEIKINGSQVALPPVEPTPIAPAPSVMNDFIGINAFVDDPTSVTQVAKFIREYHSWNWDEGNIWPFSNINTIPNPYAGYPNNQNKFAPSWAGGGGWNFDTYYGNLKAGGYTVAPAIKESVAWITAGSENKPLSAGENSVLPASYIEHADHMYQFAARYGSTAVADSNLKLAPGQPRSTGLGYLTYFENWNEPDNTWDTIQDYFKPYEFAAMSSADYDGHLGTLGSTVGVKNADPNAKMVMGGLSDPKIDYLRALKFWSDYNRGGSFPYDVINFHYYSHDGATQSEGKVGVSPEDDDMVGALSKVVEFRNKYYPDKEVWITEFGYDSDTQSKQRVPAVTGQSPELTQANMIVRSYLAAAAAGVDKAVMYMLRDVELGPTDDMKKFYKSGLVGRKEDGHPPKISWYYLYTFRNTLGDMYFLGEEKNTNNPNVMIYKFKSATSNAGAYVVWNKTSSNLVTNGYNLTLQGNPTNASQVVMANNDTDGQTTSLTISSNKKVTVNVSETPLFVLVNDIQ